jgi:hypothetical protein
MGCAAPSLGARLLRFTHCSAGHFAGNVGWLSHAAPTWADRENVLPPALAARLFTGLAIYRPIRVGFAKPLPGCDPETRMREPNTNGTKSTVNGMTALVCDACQGCPGESSRRAVGGVSYTKGAPTRRRGRHEPDALTAAWPDSVIKARRACWWLSKMREWL